LYLQFFFLLTEVNVQILGGLCQTNLLSQSLEVFILTLGSLLSLDESEILLSVFVPIMIYSNENLNKSTILSGNKDRSTIYMWTHNKSGKICG